MVIINANNLSLVDGSDYVGQTANLTFAVGHLESCHTVVINQDDECEHPVPEDFFANLAYVSGIQNINIVRDRTQVLIDDSSQSECGESRVCSAVSNSYSTSGRDVGGL